MTKDKKALYKEPDDLRELLQQMLSGRKFILDCGHHVTFGHFLGNNITILNGAELKIICSECGY